MTVDLSHAESQTEPGTDDASPPAEEQAQQVEGTHRYQGMVSVDRLRPHPEHVRKDLALDQGFLQSIETMGVIDPILITSDPDDPEGFLVIDGHRRVAGAQKAGETHPERKLVPFFLDAEGADDPALQHLKQYITNDDTLGKSHDRWEQLEALRLAEDAGASRTQIRKATGLKRDQLTKSLKASRLRSETREAIAATNRAWDLEDEALLAEFENDDEARKRILTAKERGFPKLSIVVQTIQDERAEAAEHERLLAELQDAGIPVTEATPDGGLPLSELCAPGSEDGNQLTPEEHQDCPGRGAYFSQYMITNVVHYCDDPERYEHHYNDPDMAERMRRRAELLAAGRQVTAEMPDGAVELGRLQHDGQDLTADNHASCPGAGVRIGRFGPPLEYCIDPLDKGHSLQSGAIAQNAAPAERVDRGLIVRGNKAWPRAAKVRREELKKGLFARPTTGKGSATFLKAITGFLSQELLRWPMHLSVSHASASAWMTFTQLTGKTREQALAELETAGEGRRLLLMLGLVAAGYETEMAGDRERRFTWRTDGKVNPHCRREDAGRYLRFLASQGYELAPIEEAVADGVPYTEDESGPTGDPIPSDQGDQADVEPAAVTGEPDGAHDEADVQGEADDLASDATTTRPTVDAVGDERIEPVDQPVEPGPELSIVGTGDAPAEDDDAFAGGDLDGEELPATA